MDCPGDIDHLLGPHSSHCCSMPSFPPLPAPCICCLSSPPCCSLQSRSFLLWEWWYQVRGVSVMWCVLRAQEVLTWQVSPCMGLLAPLCLHLSPFYLQLSALLFLVAIVDKNKKETKNKTYQDKESGSREMVSHQKQECKHTNICKQCINNQQRHVDWVHTRPNGLCTSRYINPFVSTIQAGFAPFF